MNQEPKAPQNPSTGGGSQPSSTVHRPRGTWLLWILRFNLTSYYICVTAVECLYDRQTKCLSFLFLFILSDVFFAIYFAQILVFIMTLTLTAVDPHTLFLPCLPGPSARAGASWSMDSSSDDSHRWSDTLSVDEKDGFVFVNYSEGQAKVPHPHPSNPGQSSASQPFQPSNADARHYNQLRTGGAESDC